MPTIKWVYRIKNPDGSIQEAPSAIKDRKIQYNLGILENGYPKF